jgi:hypothetical protein
MSKQGIYLYAIFIVLNTDHPDVAVQEGENEAGLLPKYEDKKGVFFKTKAQRVIEYGLHDLTIDIMKVRSLHRA